MIGTWRTSPKERTTIACKTIMRQSNGSADPANMPGRSRNVKRSDNPVKRHRRR